MQDVSKIESFVEVDDCWIAKSDNVYLIGLLPSISDKLGEVTFVDRIPIGKQLSKNNVIGVLETSKSGDWPLKSPITGIVTAFNDKLNRNPGLVCSSPFEDGWIVKCQISEIMELTELGQIVIR